MLPSQGCSWDCSGQTLTILPPKDLSLLSPGAVVSQHWFFCVPPLNAIAAKLQAFNECIIGACSFVPMCAYLCMEATEEDGMGESKCEACVSKKNNGKITTVALRNQVHGWEKTCIVLCPPCSSARTQIYVWFGSDLQPSNMAGTKSSSGTDSYTPKSSGALVLLWSFSSSENDYRLDVLFWVEKAGTPASDPHTDPLYGARVCRLSSDLKKRCKQLKFDISYFYIKRESKHFCIQSVSS